MSAKSWFSINASADRKQTEILIYDQIGKDWWTGDGVAAKDFAETFSKIPKDHEISVRINSPGGSVWDGLAIHSLLETRKAQVETHVDGLAASIASVIALAGRKTTIAPSALYMVHNPWGGIVGNAEQMRKYADDLDKHAQSLIGIYARKTSKTEEQIKNLMDAETWFTGDEAKAAGFADELNQTTDAQASINFDLSRFRNVPNAALKGCALASANNQPKGTTMDPVTHTVADAKPAPQLDTAAVIAAINALGDKLTPAPTAPVAAEPVRPQIKVVGTAYDKYAEMQAGADRRAFSVKAWNDIRANHPLKGGPQANTIDSALTTALLSDTVVTVLQNRLAPLQSLFIDIQTDPVKPKATIQVPSPETGATAQTNPTDWESGDTTVDNIAVTMAEYSVSWHVTNAELQSGTRMEWLAGINAVGFANKILDVVAANLTAANYTNDAVVSAAAAFGGSDMIKLWAAAKNFTLRNVVLDGAYYARLIPTSLEGIPVSNGGAGYGFDGIWYSNRWSAAGANVQGFVASPEAMIIAAGLPIEPPGMGYAFNSIGSAVVPMLNIPVQTSSWFKPGTRVQWQALDIMLGTAVGDPAALTLVTSA